MFSQLSRIGKLMYIGGAHGNTSPPRKRGDFARLTIERLEDRVVPNAAPMINSAMLDSFSPKTNDILTVTVSASDSDSDAITFDYVWKVNGNTVKSTLATSSTSDTLDLSQSGNGNKNDYVSVVITPYDPYTSGMTANPGATVANTAPTFSISNQENLRGDVVALQVNVSDADGDTLSYSAMGLPPDLSINSSTGLISGTVSSSAVTNQAYLASVTVNDGGGNVNQNFNWTIVNHAPTLTGHAFYVEKNQPLGNINFLDYADDQDSNDTLTFTPGTGPWQGQLTYNNGIWTYTPASNWTGTDTINGTVSDGAANSTSAYFPFHVVLQTPSQLYATYLAAVATADAEFADSVEAPRIAMEAARAAANATLASATSVLDQAYEAALDPARLLFSSQWDAALADYDSAVESAEDAYWTRVGAADAVFDTAQTDAELDQENAVSAAQAVFDQAIADADADYNDAVEPYLVARDAAEAYALANPTDQQAQTDLAAADQALADAIAQAEGVRVPAYESAEAQRESSILGAYDSFETQGGVAYADLDDEWGLAATEFANTEAVASGTMNAALESTITALDDVEFTAGQAYAASLEALQNDYDLAVETALDDYENAVTALLASWAAAEQTAWDAYASALAALPGAPATQDRVLEPRLAAIEEPPTPTVQYFPLAAAFTVSTPPGSEGGQSPTRPPAPMPDWGYIAAQNGQYVLENGNWFFQPTEQFRVSLGLQASERIPITRDAIPNFEAWATPVPTAPGATTTQRTFFVAGLDGSAADMRKIDQEIARRMGWFRADGVTPNVARVEAWREANGLRRHHLDGRGNVQLVPDALHGAHHSGGARLLRVQAQALRAAGAGMRAMGVGISVLVVWEIFSSQAQAAPPTTTISSRVTRGVQTAQTALVGAAASADTAAVGVNSANRAANVGSRLASVAGFANASANLQARAASLASRSQSISNVGGRRGTAAMYAAIFYDGYQALAAAYDYQNPQNWENYIAAHQGNINNAAFYWEGQRWQGVFDNPAMSFMGVALNPVGAISRSTTNVAGMTNEFERMSQLNAQTTARMNAIDRMVEQQGTRYQSSANATAIQSATTAELQTWLASEVGLFTARQTYLVRTVSERQQWWWNRTASAASLDADIARTQRQLQQYQEQIDRINAELQRRGAN